MRRIFLNAPARGRSETKAAPVGAWSDEGGFDGSAGEHLSAEERKKIQQQNAQQRGKTLLGG